MEYDNLISYIVGAKNRLMILFLLKDQGLTAREISNITTIDYRHVWLKLQELKSKGLVTHNDVKKNRIYRLTPLGDEILLKVEQRD